MVVLFHDKYQQKSLDYFTSSAYNNPMFYTTKFFNYKDDRYNNIFLFSDKNESYPVIAHNKEKPSHIFIYGKGTVKAPKTCIFVEKPSQIKNYEDIYKLVTIYGYKATALMLGFDVSSFGDQYPISAMANFTTHGEKYLKWLNIIAELDQKLLDYFLSCGVSVKNNNYGMWLFRNGNSLFRKNPFIGFNIETCLFGIAQLREPSIDVFGLDNNLSFVFNYLLGFNTDEMSLKDKLGLAGIDSELFLKLINFSV